MFNCKSILIILFTLLIYGCSSKFVYNNLDWIIEWYIDDYVSLSSSQNNLVEKRLDVLHQWHRKQELIKYRNQLSKLSEDLNTIPVDTKLLDKHIQELYVHWNTMREKVSDELAMLAPELNSTQVNYLFKQLEKKNTKRLKEFKKKGLKKYNQDKQQRINENLEDYLGSVTDMQKYFVSYYVKHSHVLTIEHVEFLRGYQKELRKRFDELDGEQLSASLLLILNDSEPYQEPSYNKKLYENRQLVVDLFHNVSDTLTPKQAAHLQHKLDDLVSLMDQLIAD